jgi:hypothetical protein
MPEEITNQVELRDWGTLGDGGLMRANIWASGVFRVGFRGGEGVLERRYRVGKYNFGRCQCGDLGGNLLFVSIPHISEFPSCA